jgi:histidine ammonia-lyase
MSSLVMENRTLHAGQRRQHPSKGNSEDHISNSTWCARKAMTVVQNTQYIVGVEMLLAAAGADHDRRLAQGIPAGPGYAGGLCGDPPPDRPAWRAIAGSMTTCAAHDFVVSGSVREAVIAAIGTMV